jgi:hypothetical protein
MSGGISVQSPTMMKDEKWDYNSSNTPSLPSNGLMMVPNANCVPLQGKSPSIMIMFIFDDGTVMAAKDMITRLIPGTDRHVATRGAHKMSFGHGANPSKGQCVTHDSFLKDGNPVDESLYGQLHVVREHMKFQERIFIASGEGWGPANVMAYSVPAKEKRGFLNALNGVANLRFVDFVAIPIEAILSQEENVVEIEGVRLQKVEVDGRVYILHDEAESRGAILNSITLGAKPMTFTSNLPVS